MDKKFNIVTKLENDAPFGQINLCTISFLTPEKVDKSKYLDIYGFKVYSGYNNMEMANADAVKIKNDNKNHDVYISEIGKIYSWDDATKADSLEYDNLKLNSLEKTRREHVAKAKLMAEQYKNDIKHKTNNSNVERKSAQIERMQNKLYSQGKITKKELEMITKQNKTVNEIKEEAQIRSVADKEMEEAFLTDYLDESETSGFKYGCITIYSPDYVNGLNMVCFKVRGLFELLEEAQERIERLKKISPKDRCWIFEVGKWNVYSCVDDIPPETQLKKLNYAMKCHLDNMVVENEKFDKRVKDEIAKSKKETEINNKIIEDKLEKAKAKPNVKSVGKTEDDKNIESIFNFLKDDEIDEMMANKKTNTVGESVVIDI